METDSRYVEEETRQKEAFAEAIRLGGQVVAQERIPSFPGESFPDPRVMVRARAIRARRRGDCRTGREHRDKDKKSVSHIRRDDRLGV